MKQTCLGLSAGVPSAEQLCLRPHSGAAGLRGRALSRAAGSVGGSLCVHNFCDIRGGGSALSATGPLLPHGGYCGVLPFGTALASRLAPWAFASLARRVETGLLSKASNAMTSRFSMSGSSRRALRERSG